MQKLMDNSPDAPKFPIGPCAAPNGLISPRDGTGLIGPSPGYSHRVLIVEDDVSLSKFLRRELNTLKFAVDVSNNSDSAFENLQTTGYDLLILDLNLPGLVDIERVHAASDCHAERIAYEVKRVMVF